MCTLEPLLYTLLGYSHHCDSAYLNQVCMCIFVLFIRRLVCVCVCGVFNGSLQSRAIHKLYKGISMYILWFQNIVVHVHVHMYSPSL